MKIIGIMDGKGGTAKSTTSVNLSACLADTGKKILLIDLDPYNIGSTLYLSEVNREERELFDIFIGKSQKNLSELIRPTKIENVHIIPASQHLIGFEKRAKAVIVLPDLLKKIPKAFDYIIIDCPPTLGLLTLNIGASVDEVVIPIEASFLGASGIGPIADELTYLKEGIPSEGQAPLNSKLNVCGILICKVEPTKHAKEIVEKIKQAFGKLVFHTMIRKNVRVMEAPAKGMPIITYAPQSHGAADYINFTKEFLKRVEGDPKNEKKGKGKSRKKGK
jgi:chromosome partitioning protein